MEYEVKVYPVEKKKKSSLLAFASVCFEGVFVVTGIRIIEGKKGNFVAMPSRYDENNEEYRDVCFPVEKDFREELFSEILDTYNNSEDEEDEKPKKKPKGKKK